MSTEAEYWEQRQIQVEQEFRQQLQELLPDLDGLIRQLRSIPNSMPPPPDYQFSLRGDLGSHNFWVDAVRSVYNEYPSRSTWEKTRIPELYGRYSVKPIWDDYAEAHGTHSRVPYDLIKFVPYRYRWTTYGEKQDWIQCDTARFLSWAVHHLADLPNYYPHRKKRLPYSVPQTLIDHLSSSQKYELRRQTIRLSQAEPISRWCDDHIHVSQIAADIQGTMKQVVIQMRSMTDSL